MSADDDFCRALLPGASRYQMNLWPQHEGLRVRAPDDDIRRSVCPTLCQTDQDDQFRNGQRFPTRGLRDSSERAHHVRLVAVDSTRDLRGRAFAQQQNIIRRTAFDQRPVQPVAQHEDRQENQTDQGQPSDGQRRRTIADPDVSYTVGQEKFHRAGLYPA